MVMRCANLTTPLAFFCLSQHFLCSKFSEKKKTFERKCHHGYVTWHLPSIQMSIEPGLHGVPSITLAASFAEKRYWGSFGLQNREHGWPEIGMRNNKENNFICN